MNKVQVDIFGLTVSSTSHGAYALVLKEIDGRRRMPIIIGGPEAQSIANEIEGIRAQRPMTHDLLKAVIEALGGQLKEVAILQLKEGTFYATLIFEYSNLEVDARPSDAIALALRFGVPIYVLDEILEEASVRFDEDDDDDDSDSADGSIPDDDDDDAESTSLPIVDASDEPKQPLSLAERLQQALQDAIKQEDYEKAAKLRDELKQTSSKKSK
ncbi:MAG: bifunctional nuclease family protein [Ignavibacteria bacterium]|nr:bifunctional nuclease family protein [Ignavibacteria bacterium]